MQCNCAITEIKSLNCLKTKVLNLLSYYAYNAKSEPEKGDEAKKSEQEFDESMGERVKLRRQKKMIKRGVMND